jgi:hypothetical protein
MSHKRLFHSITVAATGQTATTTISTSTGNTIPNTLAGTRARFTRFAATGACFIRVGNGAQTAVTTDMLLLPNVPQIVSTLGMTNWAAIDNGVSVVLNVTPLEDS